MASRLYPTTRRLFSQVMRGLGALGFGAVLSPLALSLIALYITGLLLLDRRQNGTRIADWLPARAHDAINRLLRTHPISARALMKAIRHWAKHLGSGYLAIDDVVVAQPFCWLNPLVGWTYCTSERRKVRGFHVVVLLWCTGSWRIPVAFRLWRPKKNCHPKRYRKKAKLAWEMIIEVLPMVLRKRSRWSIETLFRDAKQFSGLAACQCRVDQALVRHVAFVLIGFVILQRLRLHPKENLGEAKDRLQREAMTGRLPAPKPLRGKVGTVHLLTA
jgi:hypothetical protein